MGTFQYQVTDRDTGRSFRGCLSAWTFKSALKRLRDLYPDERVDEYHWSRPR